MDVRTKAEKFVEEYRKERDVVAAFRSVSSTTDEYYLAKAGKAMLEDPLVQQLLEEAETVQLDRAGIAQSLTAIITDSGSTPDQKIKAAMGLERLTRFGQPDETDNFQAAFEKFLVGYGDVLDEFVEGKPDRFNEIFRPKLDKTGQVTFDVKKNVPHSERRERMIVLLRYLISKNVFL